MADIMSFLDLMPYKHLTPIVDLTYRSYRLLLEQVYANARAVPAPRHGGGLYGHLCIAMSPEDYAMMEGSEPYGMPMHPPDLKFPVDADDEAIAAFIEEDDQKIADWNLYHYVYNHLLKQIHEAVPSCYFSSLTPLEFESSSPYQLLQELKQDDDFELPGDVPVDIIKRVRTTSLSLCRYLQEQGIIRIVQDYYQECLEEDVLHRFDALREAVINASPCQGDYRMRALMDELVGYLHYYSANQRFMSKAMTLFAFKLCETLPIPIRQRLFASLFGIFLQATREHTHALCIYFVMFLQGCLVISNSEDQTAIRSDWGRLSVEQLLKSDAVDLILQIMEDMDLFFEPLKEHDSVRKGSAYSANLFLSIYRYFLDNPLHPRCGVLVPVLEDKMQILLGLMGDGIGAAGEEDDFDIVAEDEVVNENEAGDNEPDGDDIEA